MFSYHVQVLNTNLLNVMINMQAVTSRSPHTENDQISGPTRTKPFGVCPWVAHGVQPDLEDVLGVL